MISLKKVWQQKNYLLFSNSFFHIVLQKSALAAGVEAIWKKILLTSRHRERETSVDSRTFSSASLYNCATIIITFMKSSIKKARIWRVSNRYIWTFLFNDFSFANFGRKKRVYRKLRKAIKTWLHGWTSGSLKEKLFFTSIKAFQTIKCFIHYKL